jgi:glycosyltransferase involved in cell wall biosynthesis
MQNSDLCLTVVMPCFNEEATIKECTTKVLESRHVGEPIIVDDGSTDKTRALLATMTDLRVRILLQEVNRGKGATIARGFKSATLPYVIVQDADLEYDPTEFFKLLQPLIDGKADAVFGSRFIGSDAHRVLYFWHSVANRMLTLASNAFTNLNLTDMETCYKCFKREVIQSIDLREERFGIEPELASKVAKGRWKIYEVGISYSGRTYDEGKRSAPKMHFAPSIACRNTVKSRLPPRTEFCCFQNSDKPF